MYTTLQYVIYQGALLIARESSFSNHRFLHRPLKPSRQKAVVATIFSAVRAHVVDFMDSASVLQVGSNGIAQEICAALFDMFSESERLELSHSFIKSSARFGHSVGNTKA